MAVREGDVRLVPERSPSRRRRLHVLAPEQLTQQQKIRRARLTVFGAAGIIVAALLLVAIGSALVVSQQFRLDGVEQSLAAVTTQNTNLQLQRAELASPAKVLAVAQKKLGMVSPTTVTYLVPVKVGTTVGSTKHTLHR
jgi:cell division protein FtsL